MLSWARLADACTAPRVALLAVVAVISMTVLQTSAEGPLYADLQAAVALQKSAAPEKLPLPCREADLQGAAEPFYSFDGRQVGYSQAEAFQILCAMRVDREAGKRVYLYRHFPLDMLFAASYGLALTALLLFLLRAYSVHRGSVRYLAIVPLAAGLVDIAENLAVRAIVTGELPPDPNLVHFASALTRLKWGLVSVSAAGILVVLVWYLLSNSIRAARVGPGSPRA